MASGKSHFLPPSVDRRVLYLAHPLAGSITHNLASVRTWHRFLMEHEPDVAIIAPWVAAVDAGADDNLPEARKRGLLDAVEIVRRCDGIVLCGPRISSGMAAEMDAARAARKDIYDLTDGNIYDLRDTTPHSDDLAARWPRLDFFEVF